VTKTPKEKYSSNDLEFVQSLGAAVLEQAPRRLHIVLVFWVLTIVLLLIWMSVAEVDEITRGREKSSPAVKIRLSKTLKGELLRKFWFIPEIMLKQDNFY
jgi:adhesin transport system membrane fusion protein